MSAGAIQRALELAPLVATYCRRPAVRHELGLEETTNCTATLLAASDRNLHFVVETADGRRWLARLATGSALGLSSAKQTAYTARAQRLVEVAKIGPHVCYVDATLYHLPYGLMVMEYVPGVALDYDDTAQMTGAARLLSNLHRQPVPADHALQQRNGSYAAFQAAVIKQVDQYRQGPSADPDLAALFAQAVSALPATAPLPAAQATLVHSAPYARNWCVAAAPAPLVIGGFHLPGVAPRNLRLIDWATAHVGDPLVDVSLLLADARRLWSIDPEQTRARREQFIRAYVAAQSHVDAAALRIRLAFWQPLADLALAVDWARTGPAASAELRTAIGAYLASGESCSHAPER